MHLVFDGLFLRTGLMGGADLPPHQDRTIVVRMVKIIMGGHNVHNLWLFRKKFRSNVKNSNIWLSTEKILNIIL